MLCAVIFPTEIVFGLTVVEFLPTFFVFDLLFKLLLLTIVLVVTGRLTVFPYFIGLIVEGKMDASVDAATAVVAAAAVVTFPISAVLIVSFSFALFLVVNVVVIVVVVAAPVLVVLVVVVVIDDALPLAGIVEFKIVDGVFGASIMISCVEGVVVAPLAGRAEVVLGTRVSDVARPLLAARNNSLYLVVSWCRDSIAIDLLIRSINSDFTVVISFPALSVDSSSGIKVTKGWGVMKPVKMLRFTVGFMKLDTTNRSR